MKIFFRWTLASVCLFCIAVVWQWPVKQVRVIACDVGQGDAILITQGFNQIMIDSGPGGGNVSACLGRHVPFWDRSIELVMVTHTDEDHAGGVDNLIDHYTTGMVVSNNYEKLNTLLHLKNIRLLEPEIGQKFKVGTIVLSVLWPSVKVREEGTSNLQSIVIRMEAENRSVLITGDLPSEGERALMEGGKLLPVEVLKVAHHGSASSTTEPFLRVLKPLVAIISVGKHNRYGHPDDEVLERLKTCHIPIMRTDIQGDVVLQADRSGWRRIE